MTACPTCRADMELLPDETPVGPVYHCPNCGRCVAARTLNQPQPRADAASMSRGRAVQGKLPGLDRGRATTAVRELEEPIQARIIKALTLAGYQVLSTVIRFRMHTCSECGKTEWPRYRNRDGTYNSSPLTAAGIPDLLVRGPDWGPLWLGIECKGTKSPRLSPKQQKLLAAGAIVVARSVEDALEGVQAVEAGLVRGREAEEPSVPAESLHRTRA